MKPIRFKLFISIRNSSEDCIFIEPKFVIFSNQAGKEIISFIKSVLTTSAHPVLKKFSTLNFSLYVFPLKA